MDNIDITPQNISVSDLLPIQPQFPVEPSSTKPEPVKNLLHRPLSKKYIPLYIIGSLLLLIIIFMLAFRLIYPMFGYKNTTLKPNQEVNVQNGSTTSSSPIKTLNSGFNFVVPQGALDKQYTFETGPDSGSYISSLPEDYELIDYKQFTLAEKTPFQFLKPYQIIYKYDSLRPIDKIFSEVAIFTHPIGLKGNSLEKLSTEVDKTNGTITANYNKTASYVVAAIYPPRCVSSYYNEFISVDSQKEGLCDFYALINDTFGYSLKYPKEYKKAGYGGADATGVSFNYEKINKGTFNIAIDIGDSTLPLEELYNAEKSFELAPAWKVIDKSQSIESKNVIDLDSLRLLKVVTKVGGNTNVWYFLKDKSMFIYFIVTTPTSKYETNKGDFETKTFEIIKTFKTLNKQDMTEISSKYAKPTIDN
ncbi:MAG: hypothetical protein AAB872_00980 [Patescibacteria group bacterium]